MGISICLYPIVFVVDKKDKIIAMSNKDDQKLEMAKIKNLGNFNHNIKVMVKEDGQIIVTRMSP